MIHGHMKSDIYIQNKMKYGIIPVLLFSKTCLKLLNISINNSFSSLVKQLLLPFVAILPQVNLLARIQNEAVFLI